MGNIVEMMLKLKKKEFDMMRYFIFILLSEDLKNCVALLALFQSTSIF